VPAGSVSVTVTAGQGAESAESVYETEYALLSCAA
jgi:hypothetical protein